MDPLKKAVDLLARREHSQQELSKKLQQKGFKSADIAAVIERLLSDGLLDDERFAESYVRHRVAAGFGPLRITIELKERGVDQSLIDQAIWHYGIDWIERCRVAWSKKYNKQAAFGSKEYAAQFRFLSQRGYAQDVINKVLQAVEQYD